MLHKVDLDGDFQLDWQGKAVIGTALRAKNGSGRRKIRIRLSFPEGNSVDLKDDFVDYSESLTEPRFYAVSEDSSSRLLLFGGTAAYWIGENGEVVERIELYRDPYDLEYWSNQILQLELGTLIVYESGLLLSDRQLGIVWHRKKYYNDFFRGVENGIITLLRDHDERLQIRLEDGGDA